ncbi:MAG: hypothetical protein AB1813_20370, partial [Verrucomicrobiota bacterium]
MNESVPFHLALQGKHAATLAIEHLHDNVLPKRARPRSLEAVSTEIAFRKSIAAVLQGSAEIRTIDP